MVPSGQINESELKALASSTNLLKLIITRTEEGYLLVVQWGTAGSQRSAILYSQRNRPRTWASLDTMVAYLTKTVPNAKSFEIVQVT